MEAITVIMMLALLIETAVQVVKSWVPEGTATPAWLWPVMSVALGVGLCLLAGVDLLSIVGVNLAMPQVAQVLTGVIISRGANFVYDLWEKMKNAGGVTNTVYYDHLPDAQEDADNG